MAVTLESSIKRYRALSTDEKPGLFQAALGETTQKPLEGSTLTEIDPGRRFIWFNGGWQLQPQTLETLLRESIDLQQQILARLDAIHRGHEQFGWQAEVDLET